MYIRKISVHTIYMHQLERECCWERGQGTRRLRGRSFSKAWLLLQLFERIVEIQACCMDPTTLREGVTSFIVLNSHQCSKSELFKEYNTSNNKRAAAFIKAALLHSWNLNYRSHKSKSASISARQAIIPNIQILFRTSSSTIVASMDSPGPTPLCSSYLITTFRHTVVSGLEIYPL